jgi:hypothetical protein
MATKTNDEQFSDEEAQRRFEAALRGAREVGHEPMKDIPPKRLKPEMKSRAKARPPKKRVPQRIRRSPSNDG